MNMDRVLVAHHGNCDAHGQLQKENCYPGCYRLNRLIHDKKKGQEHSRFLGEREADPFSIQR